MSDIEDPEDYRCTAVESCNSSIDPDVYTDFIYTGAAPDIWIGNCLAVPETVPIKQLIKSTMISPWVSIRFEGGGEPSNWDYTEITMGNHSQPGNPEEYCRASIKSFQYGFGTKNQGSKCKVTIVDESGSSFTAWWNRIYKNPISGGSTDNNGTGTYKMKVRFGWSIMQPIEGEDVCPAKGSDFPTSLCNDTFPIYSSSSQTMCSPALWFLPNGMSANYENGKYIYEIEGIDLIFRASENASNKTYGDEYGDWHFADAVRKLASESLPPFNVEFVQWPDSGIGDTPEPLVFNVSDGQAVTTLTHIHLDENLADFQETDLSPLDLQALGPLSKWRCNGVNPLASIQNWMTGLNAENQRSPSRGKGLTMNYDPTYTPPGDPDPTKVQHGRLLIWGDPVANNAEDNIEFDERLKAAYVVNGGGCSPVISFNHNVRWNFSATIAAGGLMGTSSGETQSAAGDYDPPTVVTGTRTTVVAGTTLLNRGGTAPLTNALRSVQTHRRANIVFNTIEAELKVQGDPSYWLCSPFYCAGRVIALVVINPFYLGNDHVLTGCPEWSTLTDSVCNPTLSNKAWYIQSVEHQIKDGSYITTYKLFLLAPRAEIASINSTLTEPMALGGEESATIDTFNCNSGTDQNGGAVPQGGVTAWNGLGCGEVSDPDAFCAGFYYQT